MTDIRKLTEEAIVKESLTIRLTELRQLAEDATWYDRFADLPYCELEVQSNVFAEANFELGQIFSKALPAVLEYMKGEHHQECGEINVRGNWVCTCSYSALARALGVGE